MPAPLHSFYERLPTAILAEEKALKISKALDLVQNRFDVIDQHSTEIFVFDFVYEIKNPRYFGKKGYRTRKSNFYRYRFLIKKENSIFDGIFPLGLQNLHSVV